MIAQQHYGAHSARVEMLLIVQGKPISVSQMGPDFLFIERAAEHPPCDATLVLQVDDSERAWTVRLPDGISANSNRVVITTPA